VIDHIDIVFLDRDGTLNHDEGYLADPERLVLLPGAAKAVAALNAAAVKAVVISNQSGVGRGLVTPQALTQIHHRLIALLAEQGAALDAIYFCPHRPEGLARAANPAPSSRFRPPARSAWTPPARRRSGINRRTSNWAVGSAGSPYWSGPAREKRPQRDCLGPSTRIILRATCMRRYNGPFPASVHEE
jgi:histidinol-phosphate phosphatase family protein